jgi:hypothetical protein
MSVAVLLDPIAKQEQWSSLYCYSLNVANLTADNITGRITSNPNVLNAGSISLAPGSTGTLSQIQNIVTSWVSNNNPNFQYYNIDVGLRFDTNVMAPVTSGVSNFTFNVTIPYSQSMVYPANIGDNMPGAVTAVVNQAPAGTRLVSSCEVVRNTATSFQVIVSVNGDISAADFTRYLKCSFSINYQVAI